MRPDGYIPTDDTPDNWGDDRVRELPGWIKPVALVVVLALLGAGIATWTAGAGGGWEHDLDAGLDDAYDNGKPVFVFFTADWCPPCRALKRGVLHDADVMAGLHENYVLVKVDLTKRGYPEAGLAEEFNVRGIPTVILMDSRGMELDRMTGGGPAMEGWIRRQAN